MTIKFSHCAAAFLRCAGSVANVAQCARNAHRARLARNYGPFDRGNASSSGRYFGLLVSVSRSDR